jgi:pimeloyl-ACP methyl ester carboxylesterase
MGRLGSGTYEALAVESCATSYHDAEDRYVPVANAGALAGAIPDARLRVLEDAGHLVFI